jgi:hypothetical protein
MYDAIKKKLISPVEGFKTVWRIVPYCRAFSPPQFTTAQAGCPPDVGPDGEALGVTSLESF